MYKARFPGKVAGWVSDYVSLALVSSLTSFTIHHGGPTTSTPALILLFWVSLLMSLTQAWPCRSQARETWNWSLPIRLPSPSRRDSRCPRRASGAAPFASNAIIVSPAVIARLRDEYVMCGTQARRRGPFLRLSSRLLFFHQSTAPYSCRLAKQTALLPMIVCMCMSGYRLTNG